MTSAINSRQGSHERWACERERRRFRHRVKDSLQLSSCKLGSLSTRGFPFSFFSRFFFLFWSHCDLRCTMYLFVKINSVTNAAQRKQVVAIRSNVFPPPDLFFRGFVFLTSRYANIHMDISIACNDARYREGTKFPKARNSKHRWWKAQPTSTFYQIQTYPSFVRVPMCVPPFCDSKKLRSNGRVFEIYRRSCNNTERFEHRGWKIAILISKRFTSSREEKSTQARINVHVHIGERIEDQ